MNVMVNQEVLIGELDRIIKKRSIAKRVSDNQPLKGPLGVVIGTRFDKVQDKLIVARRDTEAISRRIDSHFTIESLEDFRKLYEDSFEEMLALYLSDDLVYKIDKDFIDMVKARAYLADTLTFSGADFNNALSEVALNILVAVNRGQSLLPLSDNRSAASWAIVNTNVGSLIASSLNMELTEDDKRDASPSYIGTAAGVNYYIDFTHDNTATDAIIFGIKGNGISRGSTVYSKYISELIETTDPSTGENGYFLLDRTSMSINPLDDEFFDAGKSGFLGKMNIDVSDLQVFN